MDVSNSSKLAVHVGQMMDEPSTGSATTLNECSSSFGLVPGEHPLMQEVLQGTCIGRPMRDTPASRDDATSSHSGGEGQMPPEETEFLITMLSMMAATRPEIVRGISAHHALGVCDRVLWGKPGGLHGRSQSTRCIDEFWSHSWQSKAWMKYATLRVLNSSFLPTLLGTLGAVFALLLRVLHILPAMYVGGLVNSNWSLLFGTLTYYLVLLLWRPRHMVFLDILCIDQEDDDAKSEALISMGAILKSSTSMLVIWDPSWATRLWCIFELAGFLYSRQSPDVAHRFVNIRPSLTGPVQLLGNLSLCVLLLIFPMVLHWGSSFLIGFMTIFVTLGLSCLMCFLALAHVGREFCRNLAQMQQQLFHFSLDDAKCSCCDMDHVNGRGQPVPCDRAIMVRCIEYWFHSRESFELYVQSEVRTAVLKELASPGLLYRVVVEAACPIMWFWIDRLAFALTAEYLHSYPLWPVSVILDGLVWWLATIPCVLMLAVALAYKLREKRSWFADAMVTVALVMAAVLMLLAIFGLESLCHAVIPSQHPALLPSRAAFAAIMVLITLSARWILLAAIRITMSV